MEISLTGSNLEWLIGEVRKAGITYSHLQDELIDHICCDVEQEMQCGLSFEKAYAKVRDKVGIGGLERIQEDTLYIIDKKYRIMKNTMKISGMIAPILLVLGTILKILHLPVAGIMMVAGFVTLSFVFLPSALYVSYKEVSNRTRKWTHIIGFLGIFFTSLGFLFRIQHWPGTAVLLMAGFFLVICIFLPMVMVNRLRDKTESIPGINYVVGIVGLILSLAGFYFKVMHWSGSGILMISGLILLFFIAFPAYVLKAYKGNQYITGSFVFLVVALVWFVMPLTLISLNASSAYLEPANTHQRMMVSDLAVIQNLNLELVNRLQQDSVAVGLHASACRAVELLDLQKQSLIRGEQVLADSAYAESYRKFLDEVRSLSPDPGYQQDLTQYLDLPGDIPGQAVVLSVNRLVMLQQGIVLAEQEGLISRFGKTDVVQ
jgi:hypothetical protein